MKTDAVFFSDYSIIITFCFFSPNENTNIHFTPFGAFKFIFSHYLLLLPQNPTSKHSK